MPFDQTRDTPIGHQRLNTLADFLDRLDPEQFDIRSYFCGSTACALGWATTIPEFREAGFLNDRDRGIPTYQGSESAFHAATAFFEIDGNNALMLFGAPDFRVSSVTPAQVATNIRKLLMAKQHAY